MKSEMRFSRKVVVGLLAGAALVSLVGATAYVWFFRIRTPVVYGESLEFWYSDETLNGAWLRIGVNQTTSRPAVDLTKGVFDVEVLVNNTSLRSAGVKVEIKAVDIATEGTTNFIGFNVTGVGFSWGAINWEQELQADSLNNWEIRYVLSSEAPLGYTGFSIDWTVSRFETVVQEKLEFATIDRGSHSGQINPAYFVIQDTETWIEVWNQHAQFMLDPPPPPSIDFSKHTVIAAFMGEVNTGGYAVNVYDLIDTGSSIVAKIEKTRPGPTCIVTQALTQPYHIVQIAKTDKPIFFDVVTKTIECP
ncbi:MAG TPA: protease complex subunit PrcB family protein [Candidatus Bathyarchaeia archaeon]|nr:protease complex subunit PrcB family protein [Candidatus Bathyarchaeia archaeon]